MMIYGYCGKKVNSYGLFEMKEVTFSMSSEALRNISVFLKDMADMIDNDEFKDGLHHHIGCTISDWNDLYSETDVVVIKQKV